MLQIPVNTWSFGDTSPKFVPNPEKPPLLSASMVGCPDQATESKMQPKDWACAICETTETFKKRDGGKHCNACGVKQYRKRRDFGKEEVAVRCVMSCV